MEKTINKTDLKDNFLSFFKSNEKEFLFSNSQSLVNKKKEAIQYFEVNGFPTTKNEEWKYTNVSNVLKQNFSPAIGKSISDISLESFQYVGLEANVLVFVNGILNNKLSNIKSSELEIEDLSGLKNELLDEYFSASISPETDGFTALNTALSRHGACIRVARNKVVELPVVIYYISDTRNGNISYHPRNIIVAEENSQLKVIESFHSVGDTGSLSNTVTEIFVKAAANVQYYKIQNENQQAVNIGTTQVTQDTKSYFSSTTITLSGGLIRNNLNIKLQGEHAEAELFGLYLSDNTQHTDNHTLVDHAVPNCLSNELYKGILDDKSSGVFNGKIIVRPDAQKTNAFQSSKSILLSNDASINTKPQLEIFADDVKCSHGATTGQLDQEALFYLQARGIGKERAKVLLMNAFASDVIEHIKIEPLKENLLKKVSEKLSNKNR